MPGRADNCPSERPADPDDGARVCVSCDFGSELEKLSLRYGPDGKRYWIHPVCEEIRV